MKYKKAFIIKFLVMFLITSTFCYAEKVKVIEGIIEDVMENSIKVRGHSYNISDVPIKNASDETLSKASLRKGKLVELFFKEKKLITILVHEENVVR